MRPFSVPCGPWPFALEPLRFLELNKPLHRQVPSRSELESCGGSYVEAFFFFPFKERKTDTCTFAANRYIKKEVVFALRLCLLAWLLALTD